MKTIELLSPAKVNLFLAVTGRRSDGMHTLISVVAPLAWGDILRVGYTASSGEDQLACTATHIPANADNLILQAARAFKAQVADSGHFYFTLEKKIPVGAGLGGGSSNAVAALRGMNSLCNNALNEQQLTNIAVELGADCPLFLHQKPLIMQGIGEKIQWLPKAARQSLQGRRILLFQPNFSINTAWAYAMMKAQPARYYMEAAQAEAHVQAFLASVVSNAETLPLYNGFTPLVSSKYLALQLLLDDLRSRFGLACEMSGSGSCCFAMLDVDQDLAAVKSSIYEAWGEDIFCLVTSLS